MHVHTLPVHKLHVHKLRDLTRYTLRVYRLHDTRYKLQFTILQFAIHVTSDKLQFTSCTLTSRKLHVWLRVASYTLHVTLTLTFFLCTVPNFMIDGNRAVSLHPHTHTPPASEPVQRHITRAQPGTPPGPWTLQFSGTRVTRVAWQPSARLVMPACFAHHAFQRAWLAASRCSLRRRTTAWPR